MTSEVESSPEGAAEAGGHPKREAILRASSRVFLEQGYDAASMDVIAREAGVAKQTIYSHFGSKEALFASLIRCMCDGFVSPVALSEIADRPPREALMLFGRRLLDGVLSGEALGLHRLVMAESPRVPEVGELFYASGPMRGRQKLAAYLEEARERGLLEVEDIDRAAELFMGMITGTLIMRQALGAGELPDHGERRATVEEAVRVFLAAYAR